VRLRLLHLYPDVMNLYGDRGNVIALVRRCQWHGVACEVTEASIGVAADIPAFDIVFMGGGQDREQRLIAADFLQAKGPALREAIAGGAVVLAICGAYQLLGRYYRTGGGDTIEGLGVMDAWTEAGPRRFIGNVVVRSELSGVPRTLVGFENHSGRTFLGADLAPLGRILRGFGNNGADRHEGAVIGNCIGTYLHGSLLPKNPWLGDLLIERALRRRHGDVTLGELDDRLEALAHSAAMRRAGWRRKDAPWPRPRV